MSAYVELQLVRAWNGRPAGAKVKVLPNAARLLVRMKTAAWVVPTVVDPPAAAPVARARPRTRRRPQ